MRIAFYIAKHGNWLDKVIADVTFSKYSHCELVFSDGQFGSASSRDDGVRLAYIEQNTHWDIFELKNSDGTEISEEQEKMMHYWFLINEGQKYDWPGAIMSLFGIDWTSDDKKFCSYVCACLLGLDPIVTPRKLYENLIASKMIEEFPQTVHTPLE